MDRFVKIIRQQQAESRPQDRDYLLIKDNVLIIISNYNNSVPADEVEKYSQALKSLR